MPHAPSPAIRPVVLCILDGWGHEEPSEHNAPFLAKTPNMDAILARSGHSLLATSGLAVGLPEGQMGNSEVGHMNIGCGRIMMQDLPRIDAAVADGTLARHPLLAEMVTQLHQTGGACHVMGLFSPGGVHSHQSHLLALAKALDDAGVRSWLHLFLDGRDTPPQSALEDLATAMTELAAMRHVNIGSIGGRYYAMDRDKRWDRTALAWRAMVLGEAPCVADPLSAIRESYSQGVTDEFIIPAVLKGYEGFQDGDGLVFANFRADRARQISQALLEPDFTGFLRPRVPHLAMAVAMTEYSEALSKHYRILFPPEKPEESLGEVVARAGLKQFRIAETEKYPHVTFFFNGGREEPFHGETRVLIPSPPVATYDMQPEMSAREVTEALVEAVASGQYDLLVVNYANPDMVGHTGVMAAAVAAVETIDHCLGQLMEAVDAAGGVLVISADHGNVEKMYDAATKQPHTAHTTGPVPLVIAGRRVGKIQLSDGRLCDIAPTLLQLMKLPQPTVMTGKSVIVKHEAADAA